MRPIANQEIRNSKRKRIENFFGSFQINEDSFQLYCKRFEKMRSVYLNKDNGRELK